MCDIVRYVMLLVFVQLLIQFQRIFYDIQTSVYSLQQKLRLLQDVLRRKWHNFPIHRIDRRQVITQFRCHGAALCSVGFQLVVTIIALQVIGA